MLPEDGFDFLSQNVRKYGNKMNTTPAKEEAKLFTAKIAKTIKSYDG